MRCGDAEAAAAGLGGSFLAAMATTTQSVASRLDLGGEPWVNTVGATVIPIPEDLAATPLRLQAPIAWGRDRRPAPDPSLVRGHRTLRL